MEIKLQKKEKNDFKQIVWYKKKKKKKIENAKRLPKRLSLKFT